MSDIPQKITKIRKAAGLSQKALGIILGLTAGAVCNYEKGRRPIRANDFEKIEALAGKKTNNRQGGDRPTS